MNVFVDPKEQLEKRLDELIPVSTSPLYSAARYSLLAGGKRLRPLLVFAAASIFEADPLCALDPACAIEMIHTYSLIHDDLPCMDNDDLRRGKPTLHKVTTEGMALLAGDYLLTYAFEVLANAPNLSERQKIALIQSLSLRSGALGMIGGQAIDIESEGKMISEELLVRMHTGKTAALLTACMEFGAICANASPQYYPIVQSIGEKLGLAYQYRDDFLDATSTTEILGKTAGADAAKKKPTAVSLFGFDEIQERVRKLESSISEELKKLPKGALALRELIEKILQRNS